MISGIMSTGVMSTPDMIRQEMDATKSLIGTKGGSICVWGTGATEKRGRATVPERKPGERQ